jgi:prepilin-type N-terminal cleavage/methylation domain-containing protein
MKKGFTLSEVLITIGVIGVVASLTLPTVIKNKQNKELESAFKKSYSALSQAVTRTIQEDYGGTSPVVNSSATLKEFMSNIQKYYIKSVTCTADDTNCPTSVFPQNTGKNLGTSFLIKNYKTYDNRENPNYICNDGILAVADGSFLFFDYANSNEPVYGKTFIAVDTNGWRKKPNKYGHDFFLFQIVENGKFLPMGADGTYYTESKFCSKTSTYISNGYGCTSKALREADYFKNLPK